MTQFNGMKNTTMEQFNELKDNLHGAWLDAIWDEDDEMVNCHLEGLMEQILGNLDMSCDDAETLGLEIADEDLEAWKNFVNECAKEFLARWLISTKYPDADTLTIEDVVASIMEFDGTDVADMVDSYMDR